MPPSAVRHGLAEYVVVTALLAALAGAAAVAFRDGISAGFGVSADPARPGGAASSRPR